MRNEEVAALAQAGTLALPSPFPRADTCLPVFLLQAIAALRSKASGLPANNGDDFGVIVNGTAKLVSVTPIACLRPAPAAGCRPLHFCWPVPLRPCRSWRAARRLASRNPGVLLPQARAQRTAGA